MVHFHGPAENIAKFCGPFLRLDFLQRAFDFVQERRQQYELRHRQRRNSESGSILGANTGTVHCDNPQFNLLRRRFAQANEGLVS